jgi:uroporphyrinogen decarboxylase
MNRNMKAWLKDMIASPNKKALPVLSFPAIQLMGITVRELISDAGRQAEGMRLVAERVNSAASVSLMDLSVEAECFGSTIRVSDEEVPTVTGAVVKSEEDVDDLVVPPVGAGRTGVYIEAIGKAVRAIHDRPVLAGIIGPFSLTGRLMDVTEVMYALYDEPETVTKVLEKVTDFLIEYALRYREIGADGVLMAEPLAGLLTPAQAEEFSCRYVKKLIDRVQTDEFIVVYHNCGNAVPSMTNELAAMGASAYHFGNAVDMEDILRKMPPDVPCLGNVDPAGQFRNGTPASIREATLKLMEKCSKYPNFVISSGCDIPPASRWENIDAFFGAVDEFYGR